MPEAWSLLTVITNKCFGTKLELVSVGGFFSSWNLLLTEDPEGLKIVIFPLSLCGPAESLTPLPLSLHSSTLPIWEPEWSQACLEVR